MNHTSPSYVALSSLSCMFHIISCIHRYLIHVHTYRYVTSERRQVVFQAMGTLLIQPAGTHYYKPYFGYELLVSLWVMHCIQTLFYNSTKNHLTTLDSHTRQLEAFYINNWVGNALMLCLVVTYGRRRVWEGNSLSRV